MRSIFAACLALSVFAFASLFAVQNANAAETKFGLINLQKIIVESAPANDAKAAMEKKFAKPKAQLEKEGEALKKLSEQIRVQAAALSPAALEDKKVSFVRQQRDFEDKARAFTREVQAADGKFRQEILTIIAKVCADFGKKNGYTAIFDAANAGIMFADPALDVTKEIIAEVNKVWKTKSKK